MTVFVRPARKSDAETFTDWYAKNPSDAEAVKSPTTLTLCAFKPGRVIAYMPVQDVPFFSTQMLESIVWNPDSSDLEMAEAMREFVKHAVTIGYLKGTEDIYFLGNFPGTNAIAERIFHKVEYPVYRLNLRELENKKDG